MLTSHVMSTHLPNNPNRFVETAFSNLPFDISSFLVVYLLIWYGIDFVVMAGLLFVKHWARSLALWWGILSLLTIIMQIKNPRPY